MLRTRAQGRGARNRIEDGGGEVKERKKPQRNCRCHLRNVDKKRVRLEAVDPYNVEREAKGAQGLSENCTSRGSVSFLSRLIRGFRHKCH